VNWRLINNQNGFNLVELMMAVGLSGGVALGVATYSSNIMDDLKRMEQKTDVVFGMTIASKKIASDLGKCGPSMNFFSGDMDGDGQPDTPFDLVIPEGGSLPYCEEITSLDSFWSLTKIARCTSPRYKLDADNRTLSFMVIDDSRAQIGDTYKRKDISLYAAKDFYDTTTDKFNITFSNTAYEAILDENGLNEEGQLIKFKSLLTDKNRVNSIVITVGDTDATTELDNFLRNMGGSGALAKVYVIPVTYVTYELVDPPRKKELGLHLYRKINGGNHLLSVGVDNILITRKNTSNALIDYDVNVVKRVFETK
jgi:type II secretory pathway pseudopilin PulG